MGRKCGCAKEYDNGVAGEGRANAERGGAV